MIRIKVYRFNYKLLVASIIIAIIGLCFALYHCAFAKTEEKISVPIIMYHSILKEGNGEYSITPEVFESDLKKIQENGYQTIVMEDLIQYVYEDKELPPKPIILTFDDGFYNNKEYAVPLLEKYHMKAVISVIGKYTEAFTKTDETNMQYGHLRWKDINQLIQSQTIEFQNHTYHLHKIQNGRKGIMKKKEESIEQYKQTIGGDLEKLQEDFKENTGYLPNTFTYPYGAVSKESEDVLKELGFQASLSCKEGSNQITKNKDCLYGLKRYDRKKGITTEQVFKHIL